MRSGSTWWARLWAPRLGRSRIRPCAGRTRNSTPRTRDVRKSRAMATHSEGRFAGEGGLEIYWQAWLPAGVPRAVVVLAHGASEHSGRYAWTGEQLAERGYALYAIDHRGHGRSEGTRAVIDRMR